MGGRPTISLDTFEMIIASLASGDTHRQIARRLGVSPTTVHRIGRGEHWCQRRIAKPRRSSQLPDVTAEEIAARCREIQGTWTEVDERRHRVIKPVTYEFPVVPEKWLGFNG